MAEYNEIYSKANYDLVEGSEANDSIAVYGNHSTVQAMAGADVISVNGGRHDNGIWLDGDEENFIYAGAGHDSIKVESRGASIYGEGGNDTLVIGRDHTFADGGAGNDYFNVWRYENVTITGGEGKDTIAFQPYSYGDKIGMVVTDFSNDDVLRLFDNYSWESYYAGSSRRVITQQVVDGNVVISDNSSISSSGDNTSKKAVDPLFSITLQGVGDISEVANAKYYRYYNSEPKEYKTFRDLFGLSAANTTKTETVKPATETTVATTTTEEEEDTTTKTTTTTTEEVATTTKVTTTTTTDVEVSTTTKTTTTTTPVKTVVDDEEEEVDSPATTTSTTTKTTTTTKPVSTVVDDEEEDAPATTAKPNVNNTTTNNTTTTIINNNINVYNGDYIDNSGNNGTIIQGSTVNGNVTNSTTVDNSTALIKYGDTYTYNGGDKTITNYQQGEVVQLASDYQGIGLEGNTFYVASSSGRLGIENSRDKFVGYSAAGSEEVAVYSYVAGMSGAVDGRGKSEIEMMIGADNSDNMIYAGSGGSSMWGGNGGNDVLTGGAGYDEFFYAIGSGNDIIQNSGSNDVVNLLGVSLDQITNVNVNIGQVNVNFADGGNLKIEGNSGVGYKVGDVVYTVNQSTNEWSTK